MSSASFMDSLSVPLPLCLLLLLALHLGAAAAAGAGEHAGAAAESLATGSPTRRALALKLPHSRAEEERMAWSTPFTTNASCVPSGFCFPPNCVLAPNGIGSYLFVYSSTIGSSTRQANALACYQYCSTTSLKAQGAALFHFKSDDLTCKCLNSVKSLTFTSTNSYTSGFTQGLCPYCTPGQAYNPTWGPLCQDCGDCLSRPSINNACFTKFGSSIKFSTSGTYQIWYTLENCPSTPAADETGTFVVPVGGSFTCVPLTSSAGSTPSASILFDPAFNCNSLLHFYPSTSCAFTDPNSGGQDGEFYKVPPSYTLPTRATC